MAATMGLTYIEGVVSGPTGIARPVTFLVDSGAKYSLLPPGDEALLGVVTLEILGLVLHPFNRTLQPSRMLLA